MKSTSLHQLSSGLLEPERQAVPSVPLDFNWNADRHDLTPLPQQVPVEPTPQQVLRTELVSECLRDGLHGVSSYPSQEKLIEYVQALEKLGIHHATVGIYSGEKNAIADSIKALLAQMRDIAPSVTPLLLCLCTNESLKWALECKEIHPKTEVFIFMGSAPSRRLAQGWDLDFILGKLKYFVAEAVKHGLPVIGATEHTTQTPPDELRQLIQVQVEQGAYRFCIADTIGIARPGGAYRITRFVQSVVSELGMGHVQIDWHGHRDMGNGLANAMAAITAGANRIHVVSRGVGERAGNVPLEEVLLNFSTILDEATLSSPWHLEQLLRILSLYEAMVEVPTPEHGALGKRYNHTTLGIHTDAILKVNLMAEKAFQERNEYMGLRLQKMARTIYSAVDPLVVGGSNSVGVSPWSGQSSVKLAHLLSGRPAASLSPETIDAILMKAKELGRELEAYELEQFFTMTAVKERV